MTYFEPGARPQKQASWKSISARIWTHEDLLASDDPLVCEVAKAPHLIAKAYNFVSVNILTGRSAMPRSR